MAFCQCAVGTEYDVAHLFNWDNGLFVVVVQTELHRHFARVHLFVLRRAHGVQTISLLGEVLKIFVTHPEDPLVTPILSPGIHDLKSAAFKIIIVANDTHRMAPKTAHIVVSLGRLPHFTADHVAHKSSAYHHPNDNRCPLSQVLFDGLNVRGLFLVAYRKAVVTFDAVLLGFPDVGFVGVIFTGRFVVPKRLKRHGPVL